MLNFKFIRGYEVRILTGRQFLDEGYIYAPYIPMQISRVMCNESNINNRGRLSRYARRTINRNFYRTLNLSNRASIR